MEYYDYKDWTDWPEPDVIEYAREIAEEAQLSRTEADFLEVEMLRRSSHHPTTRQSKIGPRKMSNYEEERCRLLGDNDASIFLLNQRKNAPKAPNTDEWYRKIKMVSIGSGLTRKFERVVVEESERWKIEREHAEAQQRNKSFGLLQYRLNEVLEEALWRDNGFKCGHNAWLTGLGDRTPYTGLTWYCDEIEKYREQLREHLSDNNALQAAHAGFEAGQLVAELWIRINHSETFEKYEAVREAQSDAAKSRKIIPDERRRECYWRHRRAGAKRIEAGRMAAAELKLSEPSIRNAFPHSRYPK